MTYLKREQFSVHVLCFAVVFYHQATDPDEGAELTFSLTAADVDNLLLVLTDNVIQTNAELLYAAGEHEYTVDVTDINTENGSDTSTANLKVSYQEYSLV